MAEGASKYLFLCLLSVLTICSSGTLVGFSYDARKQSSVDTISFMKLNKVYPSQIRVFVADHQVLHSLSNTSVSVDLYLNETLVENLINYKPSTVSWLKTHLTTLIPHVNIKSIIVNGSKHDLPVKNDIPKLLSTLKSIHAVLRSLHLEDQMKASVSFSLSFLENLNRQQEEDLHRVLDFIKKVRSFVIVEATVDGELSMGDGFVKSVIKRATSASSVIPGRDVSMVLTIKSSAVPSTIEVSEFSDKVLRSIKNTSQVTGKIIGLFAEVSPPKEFEQKELKRELLDTVYPPTLPTAPVTVPPDSNPSPAIVTIPSTYPVTVTPTTPVPVPSTNPVNSPVPITNPVTTPSTVVGAQPTTNPVTTNPDPSTGVPVTTPVTNPVAPPATTGAPVVSGQSWCVVKSGALETAIQAALDYACGIGSVDCSAIQQGASCYNPNTLENHASYAFNSYYQKNPMQTSCDFGGAAMVTNTNPSTGTCVYQSSLSSSSSPMTATTPTPTTASTAGATIPGSGSPPTVLNSSYPSASGSTSIFDGSPPSNTSSISMATNLQPFINSIILATSIVAGRFVLDM
ncbi:Glucan endo-1,3-beta-glucosidase 1 [Camellia lanceoleosa]|uniref:Glucan endo-1,3-beta-glucosidase 1 n=1 Tax=Camellia lanceoleosa TaxID=1840588 RepID=A0ACC0IIJ8_9ERIC|nr:Glucan endo-1,3-beta-glucosidase 1 [Camellia lanceoleosa]